MWIEITDTDGSIALMQFSAGLVRALKPYGEDKTTVTFDNGNTVQINNSYRDLKSQLLGQNGNVYNSPALLTENLHSMASMSTVDVPEPMKAPQGKVGSGERPEAIIGKLTLKKSGTTSSALE